MQSALKTPADSELESDSESCLGLLEDRKASSHPRDQSQFGYEANSEQSFAAQNMKFFLYCLTQSFVKEAGALISLQSID